VPILKRAWGDALLENVITYAGMKSIYGGLWASRRKSRRGVERFDKRSRTGTTYGEPRRSLAISACDANFDLCPVPTLPPPLVKQRCRRLAHPSPVTARTYTLIAPITTHYIQGGGNEMRPRFPDLPSRSRIVREDPTAEEANFSNDISVGCQSLAEVGCGRDPRSVDLRPSLTSSSERSPSP
jgi:hypothetical protein